MNKESVNVITSLWTQIQLQQAIMSQNGLNVNVIGGDQTANMNQNVNQTQNVVTAPAAAIAAPAAVYPSNRGGVY